MYACRPSAHDYVGYLYAGGDCVATYWGVHNDTTFEVLTGTGFDWAIQDGYGNETASTFKVGQDENGPVYLARFPRGNSSFIGKVCAQGCWYVNGTDPDTDQPYDCDPHDILLCS